MLWCRFTQRKWFRISSRVSEMQMKDKYLPLKNEVPRWWVSTKLIVIIITPFMHIKSLCLNLHSVVCQYVSIKWNWTKNGVLIAICDPGCYHGILTTIYHGITTSCTGLEFQLSRDDLVIRNLKLWDLEIEAWWKSLKVWSQTHYFKNVIRKTVCVSLLMKMKRITYIDKAATT